MPIFILILLLSFSSITVASDQGSSETYSVGELGAAWQFPSDHLPIGGSVGNTNFVMWNILDTKYLNHIVDNTQGLRDSLIMTANIPVSESESMTIREQILVQYILEMIYHPTKPRSLIALEETGEHVFERLLECLPKNMKLIPSTVEEIRHGDIFIYDENIFDFVDFVTANYVIHPRNSYMTLTLLEKQTGILYRFVQSHVPGGPVKSDPARAEFAKAIMEDFDPEAITVVMGDMNRPPDFFIKDFEIAAKNAEIKQPLTNVWIPYPTHINTHKEASRIDNIFIAIPDENLKFRVAEGAKDLFNELQPTLDLLESHRI